MYKIKRPFEKWFMFVRCLMSSLFCTTLFPHRLKTTFTHVIYISLSKGHCGSRGAERRKFSFLMKKRRVIKHISYACARKDLNFWNLKNSSFP